MPYLQNYFSKPCHGAACSGTLIVHIQEAFMSFAQLYKFVCCLFRAPCWYFHL